MKDRQYDVFISYRRDGGSGMARLLYDRLTKAGYRVAYDHESLVSGRFDGQILRAISSCRDVVVILSPGALPRTLSSDSMFRQEIAFALRTERNVIPLMMDGFVFPKKKRNDTEEPLPEDIRPLAMHNGVGAKMEYFDSAFNKLCRRLKSKPRGWLRRKLLWPAFACILAAAAFGIYAWTTPGAMPYPVTASERQRFSKLSSDLTMRCGIYNELMSAKRGLVRDSQSGDTASFGMAAAELLNGVAAMKERFDRCLPIGEVGRLAEGTPVDAGHLLTLVASMRGDFDNLRTWADSIKPDSKMSRRDRAHFMEAQMTFLEAKCDLFSCKLMMLLGSVSPSAVKGIKEAAQTWTMFPRLSQPWLRENGELERQGMFLLQKMDESAHDMGTVVGNVRQSLANDYDAIRAWLVAGGCEPERAAKLVEEMRKRDNLKVLLRQTQKEANDASGRNDRANADDSTSLLQGKTLRFIGTGTYDEALKCINIVRERTSHEGGKLANDYPAEALATLERIAQLRGKAPFTGGLLVIGFEPPATSHAIYKVGDVITAVGGEQCDTFDDYAARQKAGKTVTLYRLNGIGVFDKHELTIPENQPRVGLVGMGM